VFEKMTTLENASPSVGLLLFLDLHSAT